eukprot:1067697_1
MRAFTAISSNRMHTKVFISSFGRSTRSALYEVLEGVCIEPRLSLGLSTVATVAVHALISVSEAERTLRQTATNGSGGSARILSCWEESGPSKNNLAPTLSSLGPPVSLHFHFYSE